MRINNITINNFRGFGHERFVFDSAMNVILGNNTTGKTSLLHAIQIALGSYLQALTLIPGGNFFRRNFVESDRVKKYSESTKSFLPIVNKPSVDVNAEFPIGKYDMTSRGYNSGSINIKWTKEGSKLTKRDASQLIEAVHEMEQTRRNADATGTNSVFPLLLSFGAVRLQNNYNGAEKTRSRATREEKAYKCALSEQVDFKGAFDWIYRYDKNLERGMEFADTDKAFVNALKEAIPALKDIHIDTKNNEFTAQIQMASDPAPRWLTYDMMSDGFQAMINIVAEMAHRCIELNGFMGINAVKNTPGIVMIDELDLYLHPHWQRHVLADLQRAFPNIQFIVTTHSPFIVQSVENRNVITLDGRKGDEDPNKRSIEEIVINEMNMDTVRSKRYNEMLTTAESYYKLVKEGKARNHETKEIKDRLDSMEAEFSDDPAYVALLRAERNQI